MPVQCSHVVQNGNYSNKTKLPSFQAKLVAEPSVIRSIKKHNPAFNFSEFKLLIEAVTHKITGTIIMAQAKDPKNVLVMFKDTNKKLFSNVFNNQLTNFVEIDKFSKFNNDTGESVQSLLENLYSLLAHNGKGYDNDNPFMEILCHKTVQTPESMVNHIGGTYTETDMVKTEKQGSPIFPKTSIMKNNLLN